VTFSKWDSDEWRLQPSSGLDPFGGQSSWISGGTTPFTGCHNFVGYNLTSHGNTQPRGVNISVTNPFTGDVQESCVIGDPQYFCELDRSRSILHGAWVAVYWNIRKHPS
jgi:hypothetical protein